MSIDIAAQTRWNQRYSDAGSADVQPCYALSRYQHLLPETGQALEVACGRGGNALLLASQGLATSAWDISSVVTEQLQASADKQGLTLEATARDCVAIPPEPDTFDVIVVSRFLERKLCAALSDALRTGGVLFYQTFTDKNTGGPSNPDFLLQENELLQLFPRLTVRAFEDSGLCGNTETGFRHESLLVAQKSQ